MKLQSDRGKEPARHGGQDANFDQITMRRPAEDATPGLKALQGRNSMTTKGLATGGQDRAPPCAFKQFRAKLGLKFRHGFRERRLRHIAHPCRSRDGARLSNREEGFEMAEFETVRYIHLVMVFA